MAAAEEVSEQEWAPVQAMLDRTLRVAALEGRKSELSYTDHMQIYTLIYNLCKPRRDVLLGKGVYERLSAYSFGVADEILERVQVQSREGAELLELYLRAYDGYFSLAVTLSRLSIVLDRHWIKREVGEAKFIDVPGMNSDVLALDNERALVDRRDIDWEGELGALVWASDGSLDETEKSHRRAAFEAREHAASPVILPVFVVPTVLRMWRLASAKRFGRRDTTSALVAASKDLARGSGDSEKVLADGRRLARCCWATGMLLDDPLFGTVKDVLTSLEDRVQDGVLRQEEAPQEEDEGSLL